MPRPIVRPGPGTTRRRLLRALLAAPCSALPAGASTGAAAGAPAAAASTAPSAPLRLLLAPYLSPAALLAAFRPLREHLERALGEPVAFYTARDFHALALNVRRREAELALLPAHLGRIAVADWGWTPVVGTIAAAEVLVLVRDGGPVGSTQALRGRSVGMLDRLSLVAAVGTRWLHDQGLRPGVDVTIAELPSINSALFALDRDEVGAVVAASTQLRALPASTPQRQRPLARLGDIPGPVIVARPDLPAATVERWRVALQGFVPDPARPATAANAALRPLGEAELERVEPWAAVLRPRLGTR